MNARYNGLFVWVEGSKDTRFFNQIIKPKFESSYNYVHLIEYSNKTMKWRISFLRSIVKMGADYIFVSDINSVPCITMKKQKIKEVLQDIDLKKILIVKREIESWYLSGLDSTNSGRFGISAFNNTENVTKEDFIRLMPQRFDYEIDFMLEILKVFSIQEAIQKNNSFKYLIEKYHIA
jgi:hypothetical protein